MLCEKFLAIKNGDKKHLPRVGEFANTPYTQFSYSGNFVAAHAGRGHRPHLPFAMFVAPLR